MNICIKNGTLISMSEKTQQVEYNKDILIENGKIVKIGENLKVENGTDIIDATRKSCYAGPYKYPFTYTNEYI